MALSKRLLGRMLLMAALSASVWASEVVPETITVTGTGTDCDGPYVRVEDYNSRPQWKKDDGLDRWFYSDSIINWAIGEAAMRAQERSYVCSNDKGAATPVQVLSWEIPVNDVWTPQASISVAARYELLAEVQVQLKDKDDEVQKVEKDLNDTKLSLQEAHILEVVLIATCCALVAASCSRCLWDYSTPD